MFRMFAAASDTSEISDTTEGSDDDTSDSGSLSDTSEVSDDSSDESSESGDATPRHSDPLVVPPFVGRVVRVDERSVFDFHAALFAHLADLLRPGVAPDPSKRGCVVLSVDEDGIVGVRDCRRTHPARIARAASDKVYSATLGVDDEPSTLHEYGSGQHGVATVWSEGFPVLWILSERSRFFSTGDVRFATNHDFELYDLPDRYIGILTRGAALECEAFSCEVVRATSVATGDATGADRVSLYPPKPTRALRRPTDVGFDATAETVDVLSAKRFVRGVMEAYAAVAVTVAAPGGRTWADPLGAGRWDETRGKLVWLLLTLDQDDLLACVSAEWWNRASAVTPDDHVFESPDMACFQFVVLLLHAPWFVTANAFDAARGTCVPFGATSGGSSAWWDRSPGKWKTRLGLRAFRGVHALSKIHECDGRCDLKRLLRDNHPPDHRGHVDDEHAECGECSLMECAACGKRVEDHQVVFDGGGGQYRQDVRCRECGSDVLRYVGRCSKVKCKFPKCPLKGAEFKCSCATLDLAERQREDTRDVVSAVAADLDEVARRVRGARKKRLYVRKRRVDAPEESVKRYAQYKSECVDEVIAACASFSHALTVVCKEETAACPAGTFDASDVLVETTRETQLADETFVRGAYAAMVMTARWDVVAFTRDAVVAAFDAASKTDVPSRACEDCVFGASERREDGAYHCVACKRWRAPSDPGVFPSRVVADVDVTATDVCQTYSKEGRDVSADEFVETILRDMTRRFF